MPNRKPAWRPPSTERVVLYAAVYLLTQLADAGFTVHALSRGLGSELMPVAAWAYSQGWVTFLAVKIGLALFSLGLLAGLSQHLWLAWTALRWSTYLYLLLAIYHVIGTVYALA